MRRPLEGNWLPLRRDRRRLSLTKVNHPELMSRIDYVLGDAIERDPRKTDDESPNERPS
jgi:hypothetical protein